MTPAPLPKAVPPPQAVRRRPRSESTSREQKSALVSGAAPCHRSAIDTSENNRTQRPNALAGKHHAGATKRLEHRRNARLGARLSRIFAVLVAALGVVLAMPLGHAKPPSRKALPKRYKKAPFNRMSLSIGYPNAGRQVRAKRLRRRPFLRVKSARKKRHYGHPALVKMIQRAAKDIARAAPGSVMLVGDLSRKGGGPLSGHKSHQSGRDADVAFYALNKRGRPAKMSRFVHFSGNGKAKNKSGLRFDDKRNWMLVRAWLRDKRARIQYVFVSRPLRQRLLNYARRDKSQAKYVKAAAVLLQQPRNSTAHDDHFHVRIACPKNQSDICKPNPR